MLVRFIWVTASSLRSNRFLAEGCESRLNFKVGSRRQAEGEKPLNHSVGQSDASWPV